MVRDHSRNVWRALRRLGVPIDLLDDATQEVFIIASRKIDLMMTASNVLSYMAPRSESPPIYVALGKRSGMTN